MGAAVKTGTKPVKLPTPPKPTKPWRRILRWTLWLLVLLAISAAATALYYEMRTSKLQAKELSRYASGLNYALHPGPSNAILFPYHGPFDQRLGYVELPRMLHRLQQQDFEVIAQARFSAGLLDYTLHGFYPPYPEKPQAGLYAQDCRGETLYDFKYPQQIYQDFADIPPLLVQSLLFIENRHLLDTQYPHANPAVDWPRLFKATLSQAGKAMDMDGQSAGGSTLATQLEKYRHSPEGRTANAREKLRQMASASVRAYRYGPETLAARQAVVREYLNSVPLSAAPGHGEVNGIADGLRVWFDADFQQVNQLLAPNNPLAADVNARGQALRQVLALIIAQRRPSWYLTGGRSNLDSLINSHLRLMTQQQIISSDLRDAALNSSSHYRDWQQAPLLRPIAANKSLNVVRTRLASTLGMSLYDLDRLDLSSRTSLDAELQRQVGDYLQRLADPEFAAKVGLFGERLLSAEKTPEVRYSFTLFENTDQGAYVRVQTDNTQQPFDLNEGSKLELGSTAKLRVLTTYLQVIAELHQRFSSLSRLAISQARLDIEPNDVLSRWVADYLLAYPNTDLTQLLHAALERRYSASPYERFFTGGGLHSFNNFRKEDNARNPTLRESLRESLNLPFVRLMRDLVRYSTYQVGSSGALLRDDKDPRRTEYLRRFADREGTTFLRRFWNKYQHLSAEQRMDVFLNGLRATPTRLAAVHRYLYPNADLDTFAQFLSNRVSTEQLSPQRLERLYQEHAPGTWSLPDQGYIARVHPLELWLLAYLNQHTHSTFTQAMEASTAQRQEVYGWLFKTRHKSARDSRIRTMLEVEAFLDIHQRWKQVGYPFAHLVPSLATALGSSGDRPAALAELIGIIQNDGVRQPVVRIDQLHFAAGTPYETHLQKRQDLAQQVMPVEVARALQGALADVVENGTARRLRGSFLHSNGQQWVVGGKTGTGDNRIERIGSGGQVLSSTAMNRTATFVFYLGDRFYGTLTAFVPGKQAENFRFTSALPVQVFKGMAPILNPYLEPQQGMLCQASALKTQTHAQR